MASVLLKCSICPKKPAFSDVSHLLTHVGSKGHLSHLHKLQVRSHQEVSARHDLAAYDRWYQQYALGRMLSDRMLQKEVKKTSRRGRPPTQAQIKSAPEYKRSQSQIPALDTQPTRTRTRQLHSTRPPRKTKRPKHDLDSDDDDSDYDDSPTRERGRRRTRLATASPPKRSWSHGDEHASDADCAGVSDPITPKSVEGSPTLKGVVWPGMDLFDAATEDMRRRRNQKKDGSTLKKMEKTSESVLPSEAIYSPEGSWLKTRVITGNVDESSPLRGETPIPKPVRRRRLPLSETDGNIPRVQARKTRVPKRRTRAQQLQDGSVKRSSPYSLRSSAAGSYRATSRFSPTEDENTEFRLTVGNLKDKKKRGNFAIFNDDGYTRAQDQPRSMVSDLDGTRSNPPLAQRYIQQPSNRPQMQFMTTPWLQPQYQQSTAYHSMYNSTEQHGLATGPYFDFGLGGKENLDSAMAIPDRNSGYGKSSDAATVTAQDHFRGLQAPRLGTNFGLGGLNMFDDPFAYASNPLSAAFQHLPTNLDASFLAAPTPYHSGPVLDSAKEVLSPNATISETDALDNGQSAFITSE